MNKLFPFCFIIFFLIDKTFAQTASSIKEVVYITAITQKGNDNIIDADYVQMLSGKAAIKAAKKFGEAEYDINAKGDTSWYVPNDYFILNENKKIRKLILASTVQIFLVKGTTSAIIKSNAAQLKLSHKEKLFTLTIVNNKIIKIEEIYTP